MVKKLSGSGTVRSFATVTAPSASAAVVTAPVASMEEEMVPLAMLAGAIVPVICAAETGPLTLTAVAALADVMA